MVNTRSSYGQTSRDALPISKKRKQVADKTSTKRITLRANKEGIVPSVPENWEDPIIKVGGVDRFWKCVNEKQHDQHPFAPAGYNFKYIDFEACEREYIPSNSVLKFRFEQGQFPLSSTKFANSLPVQGWDEWVDKVLAKPANVNALSDAGVFNAVRISSRLFHIRKEKRLDIWRAILARWSTFSHTMITAWGEFTFTLEDVCILLELPCYERHDISSIKLTEQEKCIYNFFRSLLKSEGNKSKVARFSNWINLFFRKYNPKESEIADPTYPDHKFELVALLVMWLARHVLPGCPDDGISLALIPIAIRIAKGVNFSLAPYYLGSLYKRLDLYQSKTEDSAGRYKVLTYVDATFVQMCLWERFNFCAPEPNVYCSSRSSGTSNSTTVYRNDYRAWAWLARTSKRNVLEMMDVANEFNPRPYVNSLNGYGSPALYYDLSDSMSIQRIHFYLWVMCPALPCMIESSSSGITRDLYSAEIYPVSRVARQFGYDQGVPPAPVKTSEMAFATSAFWFLKDSIRDFPIKSLTIPALDRVGMYSFGWLTYWTVCLDKWKTFVQPLANLRAKLKPPNITTNDISLRMPDKPRQKASTIIDIGDGEEEDVSNIHRRKKSHVSSQASQEDGLNTFEANDPQVEEVEGQANTDSDDEGVEPYNDVHDETSNHSESETNVASSKSRNIRIRDYASDVVEIDVLLSPPHQRTNYIDIVQSQERQHTWDTTQNDTGDVEVSNTVLDVLPISSSPVPGVRDSSLTPGTFGETPFNASTSGVVTFGVGSTFKTNAFGTKTPFGPDAFGVSTIGSTSSQTFGTNISFGTSREDFHGFFVVSQHRRYLEEIYQKEGEFWSTCTFQTKELISYMLDLLGKALVIADAPWSDIPPTKLQQMLALMDDVARSGFRLRCLASCTSKAKAILSIEVDQAQVEAKLSEVKKKLVSLKQEMETHQREELELQNQLDTIFHLRNSSSSPWNNIME